MIKQKVIEDNFLSIISAINIFITINLAEHFFSFRYQIAQVDLSQYLHQNIFLLQCCDTYSILLCLIIRD